MSIKNPIKIFFLPILLFTILWTFSCKQTVKIEFPGGVKIETPIVRVGIGEKLQKTGITSTKGMKIYNGIELLTDINKGSIFIKKLNNSMSISIEDVKYRILSKLFIIPHKESYLKYDNKLYGGILEIRLTEEGFNVINILNIEDYLKGVVPYELPPKKYPELEALKAQAIAARTYTLYTLGKYKDKGFDICATTQCQVYNGKKGETTLSNKAVDETRALVIVHNNKLIPALYSASCGGFTENIENVFKSEKSSVLQGKPCGFDDVKLNWIYTDYFKPYLVEENLSVILKIAKERLINNGNKAIDKNTANLILDGLMKITGKKTEYFSDSNISIATIIINIGKIFSLYKKASEEIKHFEIPKSLMFKYNKKRSYILVFLHKAGILKNYGNLDKQMSIRKFILFTMKLLMRYYNVFEDRKYISSENNTISLKDNFNKEEIYRINKTIFYRKLGNRLYPAHMLYLTGKEKIKIFAIKNRLKIIIVEYPSFSLSPDSLYPLWHKVYKRIELAKIIKDKLSLDILVDLVPLKRGVSGRVEKLEVQGNKKDITLFGVKIKKVLNLKDNNFVIDRWFGKNGIRYFTFIGRGWGHGVGMCQVGAYGMALKGSDYKDILKYYYTGADIINYNQLIKNK